MHKFSIIIPVYNVEQYIEKCISSVCAQTFSDFEVVVVNDETPDQSMKIAEQILQNSNVDYKIINQKNKGLGGARNTGIENSDGEFLFFLDSDDYLSKESLLELYAFVQEKQYDYVLFNACIVDEEQKVLGHIFYQYDAAIDLQEKKRQLLLCTHAAWNKLYKRELFTGTNIRYPEKLLYEDLATTGKLLLEAQKIGYIEKELYYYVKRKDSITSTRNFSRFDEIIPAFESLKQYYEQKNWYDFYRSELEYIAVSNMLLSQVTYINHFDPGERKQYFLIDYINRSFPFYINNQYITKKDRIILKLIQKKRLTLLNLFFTNNRLRKGHKRNE